jgi:hypothetical protein
MALFGLPIQNTLTVTQLNCRVILWRSEGIVMIVVRRIDDTAWVLEESGRRLAQTKTRLEAEALEAQWLVYWNQSSGLGQPPHAGASSTR